MFYSMSVHIEVILEPTPSPPPKKYFYYTNSLICHYIIQTHLLSYNSAGSLMFQTDVHTLTYHPGTLCAGSPKFQNDMYRRTYHLGTLCGFTEVPERCVQTHSPTILQFCEFTDAVPDR